MSSFAKSTSVMEKSQPFPAYDKWIDPDGAQGFVARSADVPLTADTMLAAYSQGIFPWTNNDWYSPKMRGVYRINEMTFSRESLGINWKRAKKGNYLIGFNRAFGRVVRECAGVQRKRPGSWLSDELITVYDEIYARGHALSVEIWDNDGQILAGNFGVFFSGHFHAESLFGHHLNPDKELARRANGMGMLTMFLLVELLHSRGLQWIDIQTAPEGTYKRRLGGKLITREEYLRNVVHAADSNVELIPGAKRGEPLPTVISDILCRTANPFGADVSFPWLI